MHGNTPASDVHEQLKTNGTAIKIAIETTDNKKKTRLCTRFGEMCAETTIFIRDDKY